jgi:protein-tyrosine phosphatase
MPDVLFVCSGNTCRSPMAECLFNRYCERNGLPYCAESAGLYVHEGDVASDGAYYEMKRRGLSLSQHVARPLTLTLAKRSRLLAAMGESHARVIRDRYPDARVIAFDPPVSDPFGGTVERYRETADDLQNRMDWVLGELDRIKE